MCSFHSTPQVACSGSSWHEETVKAIPKQHESTGLCSCAAVLPGPAWGHGLWAGPQPAHLWALWGPATGLLSTTTRYGPLSTMGLPGEGIGLYQGGVRVGGTQVHQDVNYGPGHAYRPIINVRISVPVISPLWQSIIPPVHQHLWVNIYTFMWVILDLFQSKSFFGR